MTVEGDEPMTLKLLLMGDSGTGKSSILMRFCEDRFSADHNATIGVDFKVKYIVLSPERHAGMQEGGGGGQPHPRMRHPQQTMATEEDAGGDTTGTSQQRVKLTIWDTAGQERFRTLTSSYYRGAHGVIIVYDVARRETFESIEATWMGELEAYADICELVVMLVGNKVDKTDEREVSTEEGMHLAERLSALFMECSARTRHNIHRAFDELVRKVLATQALKDRQHTARKGTIDIQEGGETGDGSTGCSLC